MAPASDARSSSPALPELIFLLSLPRSGSTLLQRLLTAHPDIDSTSEPHLLLFPLLVLQSGGMYSLQSSDGIYLRAVHDLIAQLPRRGDYFRELGQLARRVYAKTMKKPPSQYFLDKSPSYCFVAVNLLKITNASKFIILWRNPLAVAASFLNYPGANRRQWNLYRRPHLYDGLAQLVDAYEQHRERVFTLRYEELVTSPRQVLDELMTYLELSNDQALVRRFGRVDLLGLGDPKANHPDYQRLRSDRVDAWRASFCNPLRKQWARRYLHWIGEERLTVMGYDLEHLLCELDNVPTSTRLMGRDAYWMSWGFFYRLFNGRILRDNLRKWLSGEPFWAYR